MMIRTYLLSTFVAAGLFTCSKTVRLDEPARGVEMLDESYLQRHGKRCQDIATYTVSSVPAEVSGEREMDVLEVKARNEARRKGATHLLVGAAQEWACKKDGTKDEQSERLCREAEARALTCVIGRGT